MLSCWYYIMYTKNVQKTKPESTALCSININHKLLSCWYYILYTKNPKKNHPPQHRALYIYIYIRATGFEDTSCKHGPSMGDPVACEIWGHNECHKWIRTNILLRITWLGCLGTGLKPYNVTFWYMCLRSFSTKMYTILTYSISYSMI